MSESEDDVRKLLEQRTKKTPTTKTSGLRMDEKAPLIARQQQVQHAQEEEKGCCADCVECCSIQ